MEIAVIKDSSLKIKSKNTTVIIDPVSKQEGDVVILTNSSSDSSLVENAKLVIDGAGEYEVGGMSIYVDDVKGELTYLFLADNMKVLLLAESALSKLKAEDEFTAVVVKVNEKVNDTILAHLTSDVFIFYQDLDKVELSSENTKKMPKVNLRKKEEITGSIILLTN